MRLNDYLIFEDENIILFRNVGKKRTQQRSLATQKTRTLITPLWKPQICQKKIRGRKTISMKLVAFCRKINRQFFIYRLLYSIWRRVPFYFQ